MPIETPTDLRDHLHTAISIEMATIPAYLYALYSFEDQSALPPRLIRSIVVEEMLHAALSTNILLAVGGEPEWSSDRYFPNYPGELPHHRPRIDLDLAPVSIDLVRDVLLVIEQPEMHSAPAEGDDYASLGQFYHSIETSIERMADRFDLFSDPQLERQMSDSSFYRPVQFDAEDSGNLAPIESTPDACDAISVIVHQGEGLSDERWADPEHKELTHYHKLLLLADGKAALGSVLPVPINPRTANYPAELQQVSDLFNAAYRATYLALDDMFSVGGNQGTAVGRLYGLMTGVLGPVARYLVTVDLPDGGVAAPTFEWFEFSGDPWAELSALANRIARDHPDLETVATVADNLVNT